jgi:hypothetical protein
MWVPVVLACILIVAAFIMAPALLAPPPRNALGTPTPLPPDPSRPSADTSANKERASSPTVGLDVPPPGRHPAAPQADAGASDAGAREVSRASVRPEQGTAETSTPANPQANAPEPQADAPEPQADAPEPQADAPEPQADAPEPQADALEPQADAPEPQADAPEPQADAPEPQADAPEPQADAPEPRDDADLSVRWQ